MPSQWYFGQMRKLIYLFLALSHPLLSSRDDIQSRISLFLEKSPQIREHYTLTEDEFLVFANKDDKANAVVELRYEIASSNNKNKMSKGLKGKRIAIDPGHLGGDLAFLEHRFVILQTEPEILLKEGTLCLETAKYLKALLESEGALVFLTKESDGEAVYSQTFWEWLSTKFPLELKIDPALSFQPLSVIFRRMYNPLDLRARIEKINAFEPDVTLIIHYNMATKHNRNTGYNPGSKVNYNLCFIPGAFMKGELELKEKRQDFFRLATENSLELSEQLSSLVIAQFTDILKVKPASKYALSESSLAISKGVFSRNLALTREIHSPLCYGETLMQDNHDEAKRLADPSDQRIQDIAQAYFLALKEFFDLPQFETSSQI